MFNDLTLVDTLFDGRDIYQKQGLYYITKNGIIISPGYITLKDAQKNAWKHQEYENNQGDENHN